MDEQKEVGGTELENCFELETPFPWKYWYRDIMFVDRADAVSMDLAHKYGIRYFKFYKNGFHHDYPGATIVMGRVKIKEFEKWQKVLRDLYILCNSKDYRETIKIMNKVFEDDKLTFEKEGITADGSDE